MSAEAISSPRFEIMLTEEATTRLMAIFSNNKTPIIKFEDTIYNPLMMNGAPYIFMNYSSLNELIIYPYGYSPISM